MVLTDERWAALEPLVEACRPRSKTPPQDLRRTIGAIIWRHTSGARWRAIPAELGPWWRAAQLFIRWAKLGVWERLLGLAQDRGVELGMALLDGTNIRAHAKAAGAPKKGAARESGTSARRSAARAGASVPRRASSPTGGDARSPSRWRRARRTSCRWRPGSSTGSPACRSGWSATAATARTRSGS